MKALSAGTWAQSRRVLRFCAWAVLILAILASLPFMFHVLNRGFDCITGFPLIRERWWERLLWTR
ncbi:MAG TPA: hypothetical protein VN682_21105 [Terriglobales bacterium]|nr:hypothetical protein [Terriglobales bacterium]